MIQPINPSPNAVRELRESFGMSRTEFAKLVFASPKSVQSWEYGTRRMPKSTWALANILLAARRT